MYIDVCFITYLQCCELWFCDDMYPHDPPRVSVARVSAAQRGDGNLRVRAPGLKSRASPCIGCDSGVSQYSGVTESCTNVAILGEAVTELLHSQRILPSQNAFLRHFE
jgi:hypothetical protein